MKKIIKILGQLIAQVVVFLLFFILLGSIATLAKNSLSALAESHWVAGVVLGVIWLIGVLFLCSLIWYAMRPSAPGWLRNNLLIRKKTGSDAGLVEQFPVATLSALICAAMLTAVFVLAVVSAILASKGLVKYAIESSPEQPMTELLFRLYMWHTIDMIPVIDIWKVYDIKPPIRPTSFWAQSIVLAFRTAIIGYAISTIVQAVKFYRDMPGHNQDT